MPKSSKAFDRAVRRIVLLFLVAGAAALMFAIVGTLAERADLPPIPQRSAP